MANALENGNTMRRHTLASIEDRQSVLEELDAILASYHFRGSKRYPALLKFIVDAALDNRSSDLKERTLGVEVFGREPGYDTSADPVVRVSAAEVRKRIAQFYHENARHSRVQIELPLGSYAPEFRLRCPEPVAIQPPLRAQETLTSKGSGPIGKARSLTMALGLSILLGIGVLAAHYFGRRPASAGRPTVLEELWAPMINSTRPVLVILRTAPPDRMQSGSRPLTVAEHVHYVSISIAVALAHLAIILNEHGKSYQVKEAPETTLTDMRSRPVILVGAMNNDWTMRLVAKLRFHFIFQPDGTERIEDSANPGQMAWHFNRFQPYSAVNADYALVARYRDSTTESPVMIIAGLGAYGTEAAGEFVQSPRYLAQLAKALPPGWENKNIELVLRTDVIGYHAGPPVLLSAYTW
jgi:hypothetical protein